MAEATDRELLEAFRRGADQRAFADLVARHGGMVHRAALRVLGDPHEADDVAQAAFLVLARRPRIADADRLAGWLHGVAVRIAWRAARARGRRRRRERLAAPPLTEESAPSAADAVGEELDQALARLPARLRQAVVLCWLEQRTVREAAALSGIPAGTLGRRSAEGLERLRVLLARRGAATSASTLAALLAAEAAAAAEPTSLAATLAAPAPAATAMAQATLSAATLQTGLAAAAIALAITAAAVAPRLSIASPPPLTAATPAAAAAAPATPSLPLERLHQLATVRSVAAGAWSAPATWSSGAVPGESAVVSIAHAVRYDVAAGPTIAAVAIAGGGSLAFSPASDTRLAVGTVLVDAGGRLSLGDEAEPIPADRAARIVFDERTIGDDDRAGGLVVRGALVLRGARKDGFARLAEAPATGATTLRLRSPVSGWRAGDRVVIPDSRHLPAGQRGARHRSHREARVITAIAADGLAVELDRPLEFAHPGATADVPLLPHVANLSRSVEITTAAGAPRRGHVLCDDGAQVDIGHAAFRGLGRGAISREAKAAFAKAPRDDDGRFPLRLRRVGAGSSGGVHGYAVVGSVIDGSDDPRWRWGLVIDGSDGGLVRGNVVLGVAGAGVVALDGGERANRLEGNLVLAVHDAGRGAEGGFGGDGFWLRGPLNHLVGNVVADLEGVNEEGAAFNAFALFAGRRAAARGAPEVDLNAEPLAGFSGNEAYAVPSGLALWWIGANYSIPRATADSVVDGFTVWNHRANAVQLHAVDRVRIERLLVRGDPSALASPYGSSTGVRFTSGLAKDCTVADADIAGVATGIVAPTWAPGTFTLERCRISATFGVRVPTPGVPVAGGSTAALPPRLVQIRDCRFVTPATATAWPPVGIDMQFTDHGGFANLLVADRVLVSGWNGVPGDDFQCYYREQAAGHAVPVATSTLVGAPAPGLTNRDLWARDGRAIGGAIAPATAVARTGIQGLVQPLP